MQILHCSVFICLLSVYVYCNGISTHDKDEITDLFKDIVEILKRNNTKCYFSVLKMKHDVCQCANDYLNKIDKELQDCEKDQRTFLMLRSTLKGLMEKLPQEKTSQKICTYKTFAESTAELRLSNFLNELLRKNCSKTA